MKQIKLSSGEFTQVDSSLHAQLSEFSWRKSSGGYAVRCERVGGACRTFYMHREILKAGNGIAVDHKDSNKLNNRRGNLRISTASENQRNRKLHSLNTSGFKGVTRKRSRWASRIGIKGKQIALGVYDTAREAGIAYDNAAVKLYGKFARTNKMLGLLKTS